MHVLNLFFILLIYDKAHQQIQLALEKQLYEKNPTEQNLYVLTIIRIRINLYFVLLNISIFITYYLLYLIRIQQRPLHTSDCPICYENLKFKKNRSTIIFCKTCGNNVHEVSDYK